MHFRITIPSLADGKKDEAVSYVCLLYTSDAADE